MVSKKQRRRLKAQKASIRDSAVPKVKKHYFLRTGLAVIVGTVLTAASTFYFIPRSAYVQPSKIERVETLTAIQKFEKMPEGVQDEVLHYLERFVANQTKVGREAQRINDKIQVQEIERLLATKYTYNVYDNTIYLPKKSRVAQAQSYLAGGTPHLINRAHEKLHFIQDASSQWDKLETLVKTYGVGSFTERKLKLEIPEKALKDFIKNWLGRQDISSDEAGTELMKLKGEYEATKPTRVVIRELQAYLSLGPYGSADLYQTLMQGGHEDVMVKVRKETFNQIFLSTLELTVLMDPIDAAKFVGKYGDSLAGYRAEIEKLKSQRGIPNAHQMALERQRAMLKEFNAIFAEAARYIEQRYAAIR